MQVDACLAHTVRLMSWSSCGNGMPYSRTASAFSRPLVSVLIPVYNSERYLSKTVASLQSTEFREFEAWFIDDGSTDGSVAVLQPIAERDPRIRILRLDQNLGSAPRVLNQLDYIQVITMSMRPKMTSFTRLAGKAACESVEKWR